MVMGFSNPVPFLTEGYVTTERETIQFLGYPNIYGRGWKLMCPCKMKERYPLRKAMERGDCILSAPELKNMKLQKGNRPISL